jgi:uncharacterized protein
MIKKILLATIKFYQKFISPNLVKNCRFWPSCSSYFIAAVEKYGIKKGFVRGVMRILKCHPLHSGGVDLP